ncbi:RNA polymerase sigma-70 factor (ECF subfamily) [Aminobacter aminovorans]|jgi:RNA polymerase sigma-70 factor (ECF subfamily)|uniref:RNA polymerase sigma factor SigJ n=1 Tax=Aminobacter aminovorans TaxID=83263 RepID=A0A380WIE7_AMIAI|nr:sigma-70 family RNA polymerase sigma factor [Aminobacter aminovorans]TCS28674.1 RNA polymerase sigma-70 factor (ECF subfamily) [Aminobacter aminovorans]SUU88528.1 RNA polymerase sigma factor SigJ [Aminobacter aminovorans]
MSEISLTTAFADLRPGLVRLAYRMLGSVADAEDVVHDAWLRWLAADRNMVDEPAAYLRTIVTRLCLNELKSTRRLRETYIGPWLPDPIFDPEDEEPADDITLPLMIALERLSPLERAAFLLHDVFGLKFEAVAEAIGREAANCRKLASRARTHIHDARPRFAVPKEEGLRFATAFFNASRTGDLAALRTMLAEDVVTYADGGGQVAAPSRPLVGIEAVMARHAGLARLFAVRPSQLVRYVMIDGLPGFITVEEATTVQTTALNVEHGKVVAIYVTRNPDKLRNVVDFGATAAGA